MRAVSTLGSAQGSERGRLIDVASLAAVTILSALPYVGRLGFYSDDWGILAGFSASPHRSIAGLAGGGFVGRPVQAVYSAVLFRLFGLNPLGYHLVDTAVLAACAALLYLLLVRMRFGRAESFATTLLFVMLPQLSTVRVWFSSFQVPLSMALMLASMHWQLSFARTGKWGWLAGAVLAAVLSVGAYEAFAPLLVGFAMVLVFRAWRGSRDWRAVIAALFVLALLVLAFLYKLVLSGRAGPIGDPHRYVLGLYQLFRLDYDWRVDSGLNILATPRAHFIAPAIGWWSGAKALMSGRSGLAVTAIAILVGAIAMWRLSNDGAQRSAPKPLLLLGITAFLLGNATFLIVPAVAFTSTGIDNRVQVAAALGVAMILASLICLAMNAVPVARRPIAFSVVIAVIGAAAFGRVAQIERYWAEAPALQQQVLSAARVDLRNVPEKATVILDGLCPYYGPAVVFETYWDIGGALSLALGRPVDGDAVSPRMSLTPGGLATSIYKAPSFYPYAPNLYVYDHMKHLLARLDSAAAATRYFGSRRQRACPGYVGRGVEV